MKNNVFLLRLPDVMAKTGLGRSSIYAGIDAGTFPKPVSIGARAIAWPSDRINKWIEERIAQSDAKKTAA